MKPYTLALCGLFLTLPASACAQGQSELATIVVPDHLRDISPRTCAAWQAHLVFRLNMVIEREDNEDYNYLIEQNRKLQNYVRAWLMATGEDASSIFSEQPIVNDLFEDVGTIQNMLWLVTEDTETGNPSESRHAISIQEQTNYDIDSVHQLCENILR